MNSRQTLLSATVLAGLLAAPVLVLAQATTPATPATPGVTAPRTGVDGTPGNPPGTAATRALDRAAGTNTSGAYPSQSDGRGNNPPGTAAGRALDATTTTTTTGQVGTTTPPAAATARTGAAASASTTTTMRPADSNSAARQMSVNRASRIIGASVYNERNESIGKVDDIILPGQRGNTTAGMTNDGTMAVLSVGGFLGIGARLVAVPLSDLRYNAQDEKWTLQGATRETLQGRPAYEYESNS